ncbi:nucleoside diphosphate kinase regulator [Pseudobdellovibrio exovorus]|uniref:Transcription elongation factor GreA/GreB C-terminal domain-containing protein n=1 Tax=Pseudobdellovibrio exovorus JSS TaxID=1184267 RepID=M4V911_9BACT|nr:nucleoside diphosphate kinase regulator [Pseudobdellovibrio exovorus]AGH95897.1 hypothetical protein A11Q_1681 [Pseudobdellovibrio exovorus JSS]
MNTENLLIKKTDFEKISHLVSQNNSDLAALLDEELQRASIVEDGELPVDVASMNSTISFVDLDAKKEQTVTLVYPHEASLEENKVSILAPIGAALIGLRVGQSIKWPLPNGKNRNLQVTAVNS